MDKPLESWYCDVCGEKIEDVNKGYVIWKSSDKLKYHDFKIIHQKKCDLKNHRASRALKDFIGDYGLTSLLSMLSLGPIKSTYGQTSYCQITDTDEFVDLIRRVQTPFYEEARRYFNNSDLLEHFSDSNEVGPYLPEELEKIIDTYK